MTVARIGHELPAIEDFTDDEVLLWVAPTGSPSPGFDAPFPAAPVAYRDCGLVRFPGASTGRFAAQFTVNLWETNPATLKVFAGGRFAVVVDGCRTHGNRTFSRSRGFIPSVSFRPASSGSSRMRVTATLDPTSAVWVRSERVNLADCG